MIRLPVDVYEIISWVFSLLPTALLVLILVLLFLFAPLAS